ncbi:MAG: hypothetical protein ACRC5A_02695, partial [Enterobacteriaceae bacterium]
MLTTMGDLLLSSGTLSSSTAGNGALLQGQEGQEGGQFSLLLQQSAARTETAVPGELTEKDGDKKDNDNSHPALLSLLLGEESALPAAHMPPVTLVSANSLSTAAVAPESAETQDRASQARASLTASGQLLSTSLLNSAGETTGMALSSV